MGEEHDSEPLGQVGTQVNLLLRILMEQTICIYKRCTDYQIVTLNLFNIQAYKYFNKFNDISYRNNKFNLQTHLKKHAMFIS